MERRQRGGLCDHRWHRALDTTDHEYGPGVAGATVPTATERLESAGGIKVGNAVGTTDGTLRWTGTDMEARKGGAWVSMTGAGASAYTDEQAQDAVGTILVDSATIDLTYTDATPSITAAIVAGSVNTTQLTNDGVTYAKIQNVSATDRLLGRVSAGAGDVEEVVCTPAGRALLDDADAAAQRTTLALGTMAQQDAANVAISGGTALALSDSSSLARFDGNTLSVDPVTHRAGVGLFAPNRNS